MYYQLERVDDWRYRIAAIGDMNVPGLVFASKQLAKEIRLVRSDSKATVAEETPEAYKDVADVIEVMHGSGVALKVAKLMPLAVVTG